MKIVFDLKEFKNKNIAVNCKTEEDAKEFLKYLAGKGIGWEYVSILEESYYYKHEKETCYCLNDDDKLAYTNIDYCKLYHYTIYNYQDLIFEKELPHPFNLLEDGDRVFMGENGYYEGIFFKKYIKNDRVKIPLFIKGGIFTIKYNDIDYIHSIYRPKSCINHLTKFKESQFNLIYKISEKPSIKELELTMTELNDMMSDYKGEKVNIKVVE